MQIGYESPTLRAAKMQCPTELAKGFLETWTKSSDVTNGETWECAILEHAQPGRAMEGTLGGEWYTKVSTIIAPDPQLWVL